MSSPVPPALSPPGGQGTEADDDEARDEAPAEVAMVVPAGNAMVKPAPPRRWRLP